MTLPADVVKLWEGVSGGLLVEGYGMTEASPVCLGNPFAPSRRNGTIGIPFPSTDMRVVSVDDPAVEVAPGERGELLWSYYANNQGSPIETAKRAVSALARELPESAHILRECSTGYGEALLKAA